MGHTRKGQQGELLARRFVEKRLRMEVVETNFRSPWGEIDLIAREGETWVFIEVKTRSGTSYGLAEEAVDRKKQERLRRVAEWYLAYRGQNLHHIIVRFDVVAVYLKEGGKPDIVHYPGAF